MKGFNEKVPYDSPLLSVRVFQTLRDDTGYINWHYHKQLELLVVLEGELEVNLEEKSFFLKPGDVMIIGEYELHRDRCSQKINYIVLQFDLDHFFDHGSIPYMRHFSETHTPLSEANYIFQEQPDINREVADCVKQILKERTDKETGYELAISILIKQILLLLLRNDTRNALSQGDSFDKLRLKPVLDFVEAHLNDRIQVDEVCRIANMSYYYFVKFFKKSIGMSFTEYVNYRKVKWAERILLTKDLSISEVGELIGMPNMAHFYKMFKKYNDCSPKQFQRKMLQWKSP